MSAIKTIIINRGPAAPGGTGGGTVTSVSVTASNGVSASVATETTTPALTFTLGAITPASVAASGTVTGSNLSGVNTGDQDLSGLTVKSANLSDLTNSATARINLGLGTAAVAASTDFATAAQGVLAASAIQPAALTSSISAHAVAADPHGDRAYADSLIIGLVDDRGNFDGSVNTFPTTGGSGTAGAILKGDLWTLSVVASSGPLVGSPVGSLVRALVDTPGQTAGNWSIVAVGFGYSPENTANKSTSVSTDQASSVKYPTVKSVYDWATGLFATIASLAGYVPITRTVNGSPLSANVTVSSVTGNAGTVTGLSVTAGKTLAASNTITLSGTDGSTLSIGTGGTLGTAAFTAASAYATAAQGTDERVPTAAGLTNKFATNKPTLVAGDKMAVLDSAASDAPKHGLLSAVWTYIKSVIDAGQTWAGLQQFSTRPRSSAALNTETPTELITLADADTYLLPNSYYPITAPFTGSGSGHSVSSAGGTTSIGWGASPVAGTSYAVASCASVPNIFTPGVDMNYAMSSGPGGVIDMGTNFTFGFSLITPSTARDVILRVALGRVAGLTPLTGSYVGFGVRINLKAASSTIYEMRLYGCTNNYAVDTITAATNASPIVITANSHNLQNGDLVEITGVVGNTAANGIFTVAGATTNTFELAGSTGSGAWTSGGYANRITAPIEFTAGQAQEIFLTNTWSTTGTVALRLNTLSGAALLSLGRLTPLPRAGANAVVGGNQAIRVGLQSVTNATAVLTYHVGNFFIMKPSA